MSEEPDDVVKAAADAFIRRQQLRKNAHTRAYLQLMRLPNVFTAMADVAMGFLFVQSASWRPTGWDFAALGTLIAASSLLYIAGMVLNDVFDIETDRRERPERPLPSGQILVETARRLGWRLLVLGVAVASAAMLVVGHFLPGTVAALLAIAIVLYDAWLKRTPLGPVAMGACRMLNVILGMSAMGIWLRPEHWLVAGGIGVYIAGVTWFARRESQQSSRLQLAMATGVMILGIAMLAWFPHWSDRVVPLIRQQPTRWLLLSGGLGILIVWRCVRAVFDPAPQQVQRAVAQCLLSVVMLDAVACYAIRGVPWAIPIILLLVPAYWLAQWIRTT